MSPGRDNHMGPYDIAMQTIEKVNALVSTLYMISRVKSVGVAVGEVFCSEGSVAAFAHLTSAAATAGATSYGWIHTLQRMADSPQDGIGRSWMLPQAKP
jgi:L-alanine-DL-glutamate epimerase-like enolase superfamily enzyme